MRKEEKAQRFKVLIAQLRQEGREMISINWFSGCPELGGQWGGGGVSCSFFVTAQVDSFRVYTNQQIQSKVTHGFKGSI